MYAMRVPAIRNPPVIDVGVEDAKKDEVFSWNFTSTRGMTRSSFGI
jgi:hypothetical protein